jgi:hypothetical protein
MEFIALDYRSITSTQPICYCEGRRIRPVWEAAIGGVGLPTAALNSCFPLERQLHSELDVSSSQSAFALGNRERTGAAAISAVAGEHIQG